MYKFGRNYRMKVKVGKAVDGKQIWEEEFEILYPITVNFQISRAEFTSMNTATFEIYNLAEDTRAKLYKDRYLTEKQIRVEFYAGYGTDTQNLPLCYAGEVADGFSDKQGGDPNIKTKLTCITGLFSRQFSFINQNFAAGTKPLEVIQTLCNAASIQLGNSDSEIIKNLEPLKRDLNFVGNPLKLLRGWMGGYAYIDSSMDIDKVWILGENDVLPQAYYLSIGEDAIFGTPKRRNSVISINMLFEPRLVENQAIELKSRTASFFNGLYKIVGFNHQGTISGAVGGSCQTTALLEIRDYQKFNYVTMNNASV